MRYIDYKPRKDEVFICMSLCELEELVKLTSKVGLEEALLFAYADKDYLEELKNERNNKKHVEAHC